MTRIITLLTDFGTADTYVGQMKGVILGLAPDARIVDLSHQVPSGDLIAGAMMLESAIDAFPDQTIHVVVVDPGVGGERRPIAVRTPRGTFVGPDNGVLTPALDHEPIDAVTLSKVRRSQGQLSATFHGRDIFAPAAAMLANGADPASLGDHAPHPLRLPMPSPDPCTGGLELHVVHVDGFGNLITDLRRDDPRLTPFDTASHHIDKSEQNRRQTDAWREVTLHIGVTTIVGIARTYSDVKAGHALAYFGSGGRLEIAIRDGDAADALKLDRGDTVVMRFPVG